MGYTHYYDQKRSFTDDEWSIIVKAWRMISKEAKIYVDDQSKLDANVSKHKQYFDINGIGDNAHENFVLFKDKGLSTDGYRYGSGAVKTNRKKYDRYVVALLLLINNVAPDAFVVKSDGYLDEWFDGMDIVKNYVKQSQLPGSGKRPYIDFQFPNSLDSRGVVRVERPADHKDGFSEILDVNLSFLKDQVNKPFDFRSGDVIVYGSGHVYQGQLDVA